MGNEQESPIQMHIRLKRKEKEYERLLKEREREMRNREREMRNREREREREMRNRERELRNRERERNFQRRVLFNNHSPFFFNNQRDGINFGFVNGNFIQNVFNQNYNNNINYNINNNNNINDNNIIQNDNFNNNNERDNNNNIGDMLEEIYINQDIIDKAESKECPICLEEYSIENKICYLPCFHFFHSVCIKDWLKNSKKCPLCNVDIKFEYEYE